MAKKTKASVKELKCEKCGAVSIHTFDVKRNKYVCNICGEVHK